MKLDARQVAGFLSEPGRCRAVLFYGDDAGLIRERAEQLTRKIAGSLSDAFQVVELQREGWPRIVAEMSALSMMGGRRVVRVREVTDAVLEPVRAALKGPGENLLILEGAELARGKLRTFCDGHAETMSIGCYPEEGRALQDAIRGILAEAGASAEPEAVSWLAETVGGDRSIVRRELEKLALLAGAGGRVTIDMARDSTGAGAASTADAGLLAATAGDTQQADAAIEMAVSEGLAGVALLRIALGHLQKLHQARLRMETGLSATDAVGAMRPPVFFKAKSAMTASLQSWSAEALLAAIAEARAVEAACKQTGSKPELLSRRYIAWLARQGQARLRSAINPSN
jgi:DNA polymerase-3 subunit delta